MVISLLYPLRRWSAERKLAAACGLPAEVGEDLQVGAYPPGAYYGVHCDDRPGGRPGGGGRLATALAYLNDLDPSQASGGYTVFSGRAFDLQGEPDFLQGGDGRVRFLHRLCGEEGLAAARVEPRAGRVISWRNFAPCAPGTGDTGLDRSYKFVPESAHGAGPVVAVAAQGGSTTLGRSATKYVVQQWFGMGKEINVSRHPRLIAHLGLGAADSFGVDPMADLGSPYGTPAATATSLAGCPRKITSVPSLIPNIGATRIRGIGACIHAHGQPNSAPGAEGVAAALWFRLGETGFTEGNSGEQRLFRIGPHELCVGAGGSFVWHVGGGSARTPAGLQPGTWYHVALVVRPPVEKDAEPTRARTLQAELYLSVPGRPPQNPVQMEISLSSAPEGVEGVSVGGCQHGSERMVDLTVTDFYAVDANFAGNGHTFAFAVMLYDPTQGF